MYEPILSSTERTMTNSPESESEIDQAEEASSQDLMQDSEEVTFGPVDRWHAQLITIQFVENDTAVSYRSFNYTSCFSKDVFFKKLQYTIHTL